VEDVANDVIHYIMNHNVATHPGSLDSYIENVYGAASSPAGQRAVGCADAAAAGWEETLETRMAYPLGGLAASIIYTATRCAIGAVAE